MTECGKTGFVDRWSERRQRFYARRHMLPFVQRTWMGGERKPFIVGRHTIGICDICDEAIQRYKMGLDSFYIVRVCFRHGKSELVSKYFPAFALGHLWHADPDIMLIGCDAGLATGFSREIQAIIQSPEYRMIFPHVDLHKKYTSAEEWGLAKRRGKVRAAGYDAMPTGRGGDIIIPDDWCKTREEAESPTIRNKRYTALTNEGMTRRAPVSIMMIVGTPWHTDGIQQRLIENAKLDKSFPQFKVVEYPARKKNERGEWDYLFPERFSREWYESQYATLTPYQAAGLLDVNPVQASGNLASRGWFWIVPRPLEGRVHRKVRYWDTAATKKENSDYTSGGLVFQYEDLRECIVSVTKQRIPAAQVGDEIESVAKCDGKDVEIAIEYEKGSMGYIGPAELARRLIGKGFKVLLVKRPHGAKHVVWQPLFNKAWQMKQSGAGFPIVEGPNVEDFLKSVDAAPSPAHDDELDGVSGAHNVLTGACESESATGGIQARGE